MANAVDDNAVEKQNWHWRNTMRPVRFFNLDARAGIPYIFLLMHFRTSTFILVLISTIIFRAMENRGLSFPAALRALRVWIFGDERRAWLRLRARKMKDYG